ncbi:protein of unknown function [Paraburkholderia dioscoreae]|uniref:Uncharacterized protein n=1 Tax=Paraburkholderia dioscoreae TaxID=2604047 RepID=A0A5Q4Z602_9BURK|nr:protein of unknown function [Paraburkholderia dioscoreae]
MRSAPDTPFTLPIIAIVLTRYLYGRITDVSKTSGERRYEAVRIDPYRNCARWLHGGSQRAIQRHALRHRRRRHRLCAQR